MPPEHDLNADDVRERFGPGDDVPWVYVTSLLDEIEQTKPFIENYYRLLAEDEGTWADWARRLADALETVLTHRMGGYEQADAYLKAQGYGLTTLTAYRATHSDGGGSDG